MAVQLNNKTVMAISVYPKESNPLWEKLPEQWRILEKLFSSYLIILIQKVSVSAEDQGMEYPMICWNYGRPDEKELRASVHGMIGVVIHEVGHNFFQ
jgi:hypothetical protein